MLCPKCQRENESGKFCIYCGAQLDAGKEEENTQGPDLVQPDEGIAEKEAGQTDGSKKTLQEGEALLRFYAQTIIQVIKHPFTQGKKVTGDKESVILASISMVLFSFLVPLVVYAYVKSLLAAFGLYMSGFGSEFNTELPFTAFVWKPFFFVLCLLVAISAFIWAAIRLGNMDIDFKQVFSQYGLLLIPMSVIVIVAEFAALAGMSASIYLLALGWIGALFLLPAVIIMSHRSTVNKGLDPVYGILGTYVMTGLVIYIIARIFMNSLITELTEYLYMFM